MKNAIQILIERGLLEQRELDRVLAGKQGQEPVHKVAIKMGLVAEETFLQVVSQEFSYPIIKELPTECKLIDNLALPFMQEHSFFPLEAGPERIKVAMSDPFDFMVLKNLRLLYPRSSLEIYLAREEDIHRWLVDHYLAGEEGKEEEIPLDELLVQQEDLDQLRDLASEAPVIKKVNTFLTKAVEAGASDVHIEPFFDRVKVRFRIDGLLHEYEEFPAALQQAVTTRVKIMAKLDISEKRVPQDGRIKIKIAGKNIDLRVSCLPTMYGESVVLRILDRESISFTLESLGFPAREFELFQRLIKYPYGIILVTGPTGSGKTTTLYSALNAINTPDKKIITIEDPVEYELDGINQVQVNVKAGLTFAGGLRSIVRQDPDVILIGEIRDRETADIAIQSALTGHLVFSTLHTNDSAGAVTRLLEIGVEDYLLSSSLLGIMAQRLVRILCPECKVPFVPDQGLVERLNLPFVPTPDQPVFKPQGCPLCNKTGYRGRTAIFELMLVTDEIKELILKNRSSLQIRDLALKQGMRLLRQDGWDKVRAGQTSIAEVLRTTGMDA